MSLGDDLLAPPINRELCSFGTFIENSEYKEQLLAAISNILHQRATTSLKNTQGYTTAWLLDVLRKNGVDEFSRFQLQRHIAEECTCYRRLALVADESR